jgi:L-glyceraldehyde 3-phosphate reductase
MTPTDAPAVYSASAARYADMPYRRAGHSGLKLPALSLGLWQNFGAVDTRATGRAILLRAFDLGVTHFDLANNYGPPYGSAEETFGSVLRQDLRPYRDELVISTKAGYDMWPGPYGEWGSRKTLLASLDQSLRRMGLDYVDIFYSHRPDPATPVAETMGALAHAVRSGKALYVGLSNYDVPQTEAALTALRAEGVPCLLHQMRYSMLRRDAEAGLFGLLDSRGIGGIAYSPLAQGLLTDRYASGVPADSRAGRGSRSLSGEDVTADGRDRAAALARLAAARGQSLAQLALAWTLRHSCMASALIGASRVAQLEDSLGALRHLQFDAAELAAIERILTAGG